MHYVEPETLPEFLTMVLAMQTKITADGTGGEVHNFNITKGIVMADIVTDVNAAIVLERSWHSLAGVSQAKNEFWQTQLAVAKHVLREAGQDMKVDVAPAYHTMTDWGYVLIGTEELSYPNEDADWVLRWNAFVTKYNTYSAGTAPIEAFLVNRGFVIATINTNMGLGEAARDAALVAIGQSYAKEEGMQENMIIPYDKIGMLIDKLFILHKGRERGLIDYGIFTSNAAPKEHLQKSGVNPLHNKSLTKIVLPGELKSLVGWELHVFTGTATTGAYRTLLPFGTLPMEDGDSTITIYNPHTTEIAYVTAKVWQASRR